MKPEQLEKWLATRQKGVARFVLVNGVLAYGLPMFLGMTFIVGRENLSVYFAYISAVAWTLGGALFGAVMWGIGERRFRKASGAGV